MDRKAAEEQAVRKYRQALGTVVPVTMIWTYDVDDGNCFDFAAPEDDPFWVVVTETDLSALFGSSFGHFVDSLWNVQLLPDPRLEGCTPYGLIEGPCYDLHLGICLMDLESPVIYRIKPR